jgi:hypothetical protein
MRSEVFYSSITDTPIGFDALTAVNTKMAVFWVVVWYEFTSLSEIFTASIIRAMNHPST